MAILVKPVQRHNPISPEAPKKLGNPSDHRTGGRNPSGDGLGGRNHPEPQQSDDGDTPAPQGAAPPTDQWRERKAGQLG